MIDNCGNIYENPIDNTKQALIDLLSKESIQVLQTAYIYAKNYTQYGEDVTTSWTTAVQQSSALQKARQDGWVEAYDSFRQTYNSQLKKDVIKELKKIRAEMILKADYDCFLTSDNDEIRVETIDLQDALWIIDKAIKEVSK